MLENTLLIDGITKFKCDFCGKDGEVATNAYKLSKKHFCSTHCNFSDKISTPRGKQRLLENIESKIYYGLDGCWWWTGAVDGRGYARIVINKRDLIVSRIMYKLYKPDELGDLLVCHKCDNKLCINPDHLFSGTDMDNVKDKINKGRQIQGEKCHSAKLTVDDIRFIRGNKSRFSLLELASKFGVSKSNICQIQKNKIWKSVC